MKLEALAAALFGLGALARKTPTADDVDHATDAEWEVEVAPGQFVAINGTIESVFDHLLADGWDLSPYGPPPASGAGKRGMFDHLFLNG
ncbi:hypothetical protein N658DRAFT_509556 [Parathielavia hyrcaniae]|uniref:Uncharacterized protein n=1 Tax=Parathielavia hyrcaniae TaxID=113614 RepID=A0AAN6SYS8_9PEZI|nr:hypothetical protein N658DRAFT_509556 [Parathielavia hyrcaniae]